METGIEKGSFSHAVRAFFLTVLPLLALLPVAAWAGGDGNKPDCPSVKIQAKRLPDLNIARTFHNTLCLGGELTVIGGHTSGFVPTPTAEYLSGGTWHTLNTVYIHDAGMAIEMKSGEVLLAGGFEKDLGIGQIFSVERYDPVTHTFDGFGCLDIKRAWAEGVELDSGRVVVSGNWYNKDGIEVYDGTKLFNFADSTLRPRVNPFMFRTARDNVMIMGSVDNKGRRYDHFPTTVDCLRGGKKTIALLADWQPAPIMMEHRPTQSFIGDEKRGIYAYLMLVENRKGELAIALVRNGEVELLPTECPLPTVLGTNRIAYTSTVICDPRAGRGYVVGHDDDNRRYILIIGYARAIDADCRLNHKAASLTIGFTDPLEGLGGWTNPALTADGDVFLAGGAINGDNFNPSRAAYVLLVGDGSEGRAALPWWTILAAALATIALTAALIWSFRRRNKTADEGEPEDENTHTEPEETANEPATAEEQIADEALMARICQLMEDEKVFMRPDLKLADVAAELNTNSSYITNCIRQCRGCTFPQLVASYRVEHAKHLLHDNPDMKFTSVCLAAGFSNETTFFRTFKRITGMTPSEWVAEKPIDA